MGDVGLLKSYYTAIHSGTGAARGRQRLRQQAAEVEAKVEEQIRMSFVTEDEFREYLLRAHRRRWSDCTACPLHHHRTQVVHGCGPAQPLLGIVGEAPGSAEDVLGEGFRGEAGTVLRAVCQRIGIDLARDAWIGNRVACRPPRNRTPRPYERTACRRRLESELEVVQVRVLLLLGRQAMTLLEGIERDVAVSKWRGLVPRRHWPCLGAEANTALKAVFVSWHPSYVLRQDTKAKKRLRLNQFAADLRQVKRVLDKLNEDRARWVRD